MCKLLFLPPKLLLPSGHLSTQRGFKAVIARTNDAFAILQPQGLSFSLRNSKRLMAVYSIPAEK
jgi:hypothetical protein